MNNIQFIQTTPEQLTLQVTNSVKSLLQEIIKNLSPCTENEILTREQAYGFLGVDSSTLWEWTNKGKVQAYGIGGRRYYKKAELLEALVPLQVKKSLNKAA